MNNTISSSFYPNRVMEYLELLPNCGELIKDELAGTGLSNKIYSADSGDERQGTVIKLYVAIDKITATINRVKYMVYGDGYTIAALGYLSEHFVGMKVNQLKNYSFNQLVKDLEIPQTKVAKLKYIKTAIDDIITQYDR